MENSPAAWTPAEMAAIRLIRADHLAVHHGHA
jgi:hypothetical protein